MVVMPYADRESGFRVDLSGQVRNAKYSSNPSARARSIIACPRAAFGVMFAALSHTSVKSEKSALNCTHEPKI
jgi:hypothetical protein